MGTVRYEVINGQLLAEKRNGVRRLYVPDPLGSTVALLDNTQAKTDTFSYWPYGEQQARTGTTPTPFQYGGTVGYYHDSASRNYIRKRVLKKDLGRWLTQDPIGFDGGDVNVFLYVRNSPVTTSDPTGLQFPVPIVPTIPAYPPEPNCAKMQFPGGPYPKVPGDSKNCQQYLNLCNRGYIFACNAYWACTHGGNDPHANCVRGCLKRTIQPPDIPKASCNELYCQHMHCFKACSWEPWWPFDWPLFNNQCCDTWVWGPNPPKGSKCIQTGPCYEVPSIHFPGQSPGVITIA